jgi:hypothetical protein
MQGILILIVAVISAIPLNILVRMLGDENAKYEGGKSIITMFICYSIGFAFMLFYMLPNKVSIPLPFSLLAWFSVIFFAIYIIYGLGARKTLIIAVAMTVLTSIGNVSVTAHQPSRPEMRNG